MCEAKCLISTDDMDYVSLNQCISKGVSPGEPVLEVCHRDGTSAVDFERAKGRAAIVHNRIGSRIRHDDEKIAPAISMRIVPTCR